jgi:hypothetical protein
MPARNETKIVKEIIRRYGKTIDLNSTPYLIIEIIRQYSPRLSGSPVADCQPPGGPPPGHFDPSQLIRELHARTTDFNRLLTMLDRTLKPKAQKAKTAKKRKAR